LTLFCNLVSLAFGEILGGDSNMVRKSRAFAFFMGAGLSLFAGQVYAEDAPVFDMGFEVTGATDAYDSGLTYTDHDPAVVIELTPSYGIYYGSLWATNLDYDTPEPRTEIKAAIGATPTFGDLSVDFNLERRVKLDDNYDNRWLPYVTGTYAWSDTFSTSLGAGYYFYDHADDYVELFGAMDWTPMENLALHAETSYDPDYDDDGHDYVELIGSATVTLPHDFEALAQVAWEGYPHNADAASYMWYELGLKYNVNDHIVLGVSYIGNDLDKGADCLTQANTDCSDRVIGSVTLKGNLSDLGQ